MKMQDIERVRRKLSAAHPETAIQGGTILERGPHPVIAFTVGEHLVTVRDVPPEATRRAVAAMRTGMARARGTKIDVVKAIAAGRL